VSDETERQSREPLNSRFYMHGAADLKEFLLGIPVKSRKSDGRLGSRTVYHNPECTVKFSTLNLVRIYATVNLGGAHAVRTQVP
jgi:hypothetical protein